MSNILPNDARQYSLSAFINLDFEDLAGSDPVSIAEIPQGSVITYVEAFIETSFSGGTTHDLDLGDTLDPNRYSQAGPLEIDGAAGAPATPPSTTGYKTAGSGDENLDATPINVGGDPTAGAMRIIVEYVTDGRQNENRGGV